MKTDKTGLEQLMEWYQDTDGVSTRDFAIKGRTLLAAEKSAMEKAQGQKPIFLDDIFKALGWQGGTIYEAIDEIKRLKAQKPPNPVVAAHEAAQGPLRTAIWELVEEMEANIKEVGNYCVDSADMVDSLKKALGKNPPEQKPLANASLVSSMQGIMQKALNGGHTAKECEMLQEYFGEILSAYQAEKPIDNTRDKK